MTGRTRRVSTTTDLVSVDRLVSDAAAASPRAAAAAADIAASVIQSLTALPAPAAEAPGEATSLREGAAEEAALAGAADECSTQTATLSVPLRAPSGVRSAEEEIRAVSLAVLILGRPLEAVGVRAQVKDREKEERWQHKKQSYVNSDVWGLYMKGGEG